MLEFELYVPLFEMESETFSVEALKQRLRKRFGGFTFFPQESEGEWETGGQRFKDRIVIIRVLTDDLEAVPWFQNLRLELACLLGQSDFLITAKPVQRVEDLKLSTDSDG